MQSAGSIYFRIGWGGEGKAFALQCVMHFCMWTLNDALLRGLAGLRLYTVGLCYVDLRAKKFLYIKAIPIESFKLLNLNYLSKVNGLRTRWGGTPM